MMPGLGSRREARPHSVPSVHLAQSARAARSVLSRVRPTRTLALVAAATLVLTACGGSPGSPSPTPPPTPQAGDVGWHQVGTGTIPATQMLPAGLAVLGDTVVLVGVSSGGGETTPLFWSSTGSGPWTAGTIQGEPGGWAQSVVAFGNSLVAVGADGCDAGFYSLALINCRPAIWRSDDGLSWTRLTIDAPQNAQLTAVSAWQDGLLAVGGQVDTATGAQTAVLLHSDDGTTWTSAAPAEGLDAALTDVATDGERLVAAGPRMDVAAREAYPAAWVSADGTAWTFEGLPETSTGSVWVTVSAIPGGFGLLDVRPSAERGLGGSLWWRDTAWHRLTDAEQIMNVYAPGIGAGPYGALVVGFDQAYRAVLYASQDGVAWGPVSPVGDLPASGFAPVIVTWQDGRFLVAGLDLTSYQAVVLAGMAYVPRPGEIPYVTPEPTPTAAPVPTPGAPASAASGTATVSLKGVDGYAAQKAGSILCESNPGEATVAHVTLYDVGTVSGQPVNGELRFSLAPAVGSAARVSLIVLRLDNAQAEDQGWTWDASVSRLAEDGLSGTLTLPDGAGTVAWTCGAWETQSAMEVMAGTTAWINLQLDAPGWQAVAQPASCYLEYGSSVRTVLGTVGSLDGQMMTLDLDLQGRSHVGEVTVAELSSETARGWPVRAMVKVTRVSPNDFSGAATVTVRFAEPVEGWPQRVSGTISWQCPGRTDSEARPLPACAVADGAATGENLALGRPAYVSAELESEPRSAAFDGDRIQGWNSGSWAVQWIEVDLRELVQVGQVRLYVAQTPAGHTEHHLYGRITADGPLVALDACAGETNDQEVLVLTVPAGAKKVRYLRVETVASPSWIAWREIEVYAR
jgi:hypothetical protein